MVTGDLDTLLARVASVSYIAALPDAERDRGRCDAVAEVVAQDPETAGRDQLAMPYTTPRGVVPPARSAGLATGL